MGKAEDLVILFVEERNIFTALYFSDQGIFKSKLKTYVFRQTNKTMLHGGIVPIVIFLLVFYPISTYSFLVMEFLL